MKVFHKSNTFYCDAPENDASLVALGWKWLRARRVWMTAKVERVLPLREHADDETRAKLDGWEEARADAIAASVAATSDIVLPCPAGLEYRPYQKAGAAFMLARHSSLNADVPRLGKTIQTCAVANSYERPLRILVVCPAVAKTNWVKEMGKWLTHPLSIGYIEGSNNEFNETTVINYDILARHLEWIERQPWDIVVFDEAHYLSNPKSQRGKACAKLNGLLHTIFLTGTPAFTRPIDLWPIIQRCDPQGLGRNWVSFIRRYCDAKKTGFGWDTSGHSNEEELQFKMRKTFMVRRNKSDVMIEIPPNRCTIYLPKKGLEGLLKREHTAVQKNLAELLRALQLEDPDAIEALADYDGRIDEMGPVATVRRELAIAKVPLVVEHVRERMLTEDKIVVFSHHRDVTLKLAEELDFACIPGGLSTKQRDAQRDLFRTEKRGIVGNMQSMGTAISLKEADLAVFAELSWVPSEIDQCEERIWDFEKDYAVSIDRLVIEDSLEAAIAAVLEGRQQSMDRLMSAKYIRR